MSESHKALADECEHINPITGQLKPPVVGVVMGCPYCALKLAAQMREPITEGATQRVLKAAKALAPLLEEGWDDQDTPEDQNEGAKACDELVAAVKALEQKEKKDELFHRTARGRCEEAILGKVRAMRPYLDVRLSAYGNGADGEATEGIALPYVRG